VGSKKNSDGFFDSKAKDIYYGIARPVGLGKDSVSESP